jgi:hypothetical protein
MSVVDEYGTGGRWTKPISSACVPLATIMVAAGCGEHSAPGQSTASSSRDPIVGVVLSSGGRLADAIRGNGSIEQAVPDGRGGWFVTGTFTRLDGISETGLAHLSRAGRIDLHRHARARRLQQPVAATATTVYLAATIGDTDHFRLTTLAARTGAALAPDRVIAGYPAAFATDGRRLYAGIGIGTQSCARARRNATSLRSPAGFRRSARWGI